MESAYALIETRGIEITSLRIFTDRRTAVLAFIADYEHHRLQPHDISELSHELAGTIAFAGDDAHSLQIIERTPEPTMTADTPKR